MNIVCNGYYNKSNLGDDLIMRALQRLMDDYCKKHKVIISLSFVHNQLRSTDQFQGIINYFFGKPPDALILGSGGLFPKNRIRNFVKFLVLGIKCRNSAFLGVGVDPLLHYQKWYKRIFEKAEIIIVRDNGSYSNVLNLKPKNSTAISVSTDLVIAAKKMLFPNIQGFNVENNIDNSTIWICLKSDTDLRHLVFYKDLLNCLSQSGVIVKFIAFGQKDYDYAKSIRMAREDVIMADVNNVGEMFAGIGANDVVLAERYHGIVLSLIFKKRFVPLIYDHKHIYLLDDIGFVYKRHLLNYDKLGHLSKVYEADPVEVTDDLISARDRDFEIYYGKVEEDSNAALEGYMTAIHNMIHRMNIGSR